MLKVLVFGLIGFLGVAAQAGPHGSKSERVHCNSPQNLGTQILFFFTAENPEGQALATVYQGIEVTQQKIRWKHIHQIDPNTQEPQDLLIGNTSEGVLFELNFPGFEVEGSGALYLPSKVDVTCTKL